MIPKGSNSSLTGDQDIEALVTSTLVFVVIIFFIIVSLSLILWKFFVKINEYIKSVDTKHNDFEEHLKQFVIHFSDNNSKEVDNKRQINGSHKKSSNSRRGNDSLGRVSDPLESIEESYEGSGQQLEQMIVSEERELRRQLIRSDEREVSPEASVEPFHTDCMLFIDHFLDERSKSFNEFIDSL